MTIEMESESPVNSPEAQQFYTIWASAGGTFPTGYLPWGDLSPVDQKRWLFFYESGITCFPQHFMEPAEHPDIKKFGSFDGELSDVMYVMAEAGVTLNNKFDLDYEAWKAKRLAEAQPKWWQVWRKSTLIEDWEVDIVAYWDWVYESEVGREEKRWQGEVEKMREKRARQVEPPATINPHNPHRTDGNV